MSKILATELPGYAASPVDFVWLKSGRNGLAGQFQSRGTIFLAAARSWW